MVVFDYFSNEEMPYKKRKKKKAPKKSDHKHKYEEVIGVYEDKYGKHVAPYKECLICGKTERTKIFFVDESDYIGFKRMVTNLEEVQQLFPDLRVVEIKEK